MKRAFLLAVASAGLMIAPAAHAAVYVRIAPPAPVVERVVPAPGPGYVWQPGYYRWDGGRHVWVAGTWVLPPRPHARWESPHWRRHHDGWVFVEGRWR